MSETDAIYALASGPTPSGIAVIRLSGTEAANIAQKLTNSLPKPGHFSLKVLRHPKTNQLLDTALILYFEQSRSFTDEETVEFHCHGGHLIIESIKDALEFAGARAAKAGEFSLRAVRNGKMSLQAAIATRDMINAQSTHTLKLAQHRFSDPAEKKLSLWKQKLTQILALVEAYIDFPDEEFSDQSAQMFQHQLGLVKEQLGAELDAIAIAELSEEGIPIALCGPPNAGKSSLFNALLGREGAIVDPTPGTTRDVLTFSLLFGDHKILLSDTAGLRDTKNRIEAKGVELAREWAQKAEIRLLTWPVDATNTDLLLQRMSDIARPGDLLLLTKADLSSKVPETFTQLAATHRLHWLTVTLRDDGKSYRALIEKLQQICDDRTYLPLLPSFGPGYEKQILRQALECIDQIDPQMPTEILAQEVRQLIENLSLQTSGVDVEEILGEIFSTFCVGK